MADNFDNLVFSSSIIIFVLALICILAYEFIFRSPGNMVEKIHKKGSKIKQNKQSDRVEK